MTSSLDMPPFRPRWPWIGPDLQTLRNTISPLPVNLSRWPERHGWFEAADSGERLSGILHRPATDEAKPLVVLLHGLGGSAESPGVRKSAEMLLRNGFPVLRLNLRGAGDTAAYCRTHHHSGLAADLNALFSQLPGELTSAGLVLYGYSQGGNTVLNFLGEGRPGHVRAAVSVCAPIDPAAAADRIAERRNRIYQRYLLSRLRERAAASLMDSRFVDVARSATSFRDYDDKVTAQLFGYGGADAFYADVAPLKRLPAIRVPTLVVHAADDPWVPVNLYQAVDWNTNANLLPIIADGGGHCGFHAADELCPWHDRLVLLFLDRVL